MMSINSHNGKSLNIDVRPTSKCTSYSTKIPHHSSDRSLTPAATSSPSMYPPQTACYSPSRDSSSKTYAQTQNTAQTSSTLHSPSRHHHIIPPHPSMDPGPQLERKPSGHLYVRPGG